MNRKRKVSLDDLVFFNQQLATIIKTKLPLPEGLAVIAREIRSKRLKKAIVEMEKDVESGLSLSEAFERQGDTFPDLYTHMIKSGEESGDLPGILLGLCEYSSTMLDIKKKFNFALFYPAVLGTFLFLFYIPFIVNLVIPSFSKMYESMRVPLPLPTAITLKFAHFVGGFGWLVFVFGIFLIWLIYPMLRRIAPLRKISDRLKLLIPLYGNLFRYVEFWHICYVLGILLESGVSLIHSLGLVENTSKNKVIESAITSIQQHVSKGEKLGEQFKKTGVFPETMTWMITMGEEQGSLTEVLRKLAEFFDLEIRLLSQKIPFIVGPILVLCLGIIVGFILLSAYLPMFGVMTIVGR